jgi:hypothetical protein
MSGLAAAGIANADTSTQTNGSSSLVDEIATKFHLNKNDVQQVLDQNRSEHKAQRDTARKAKLDLAVKDGELTQAQEDYIVKAQTDIKAIVGGVKPGELSQTTKDVVKAKMESLRTWAKANNVSMRYIGGFNGHFGRHEVGMRSDRPDANTSSNTSTTNN